MRRISARCTCIIALSFLWFVSTCIPVTPAQAYYSYGLSGGLYGGLYGGLSGGLYGSSLYGGLYGGLGGLYGGLGGLYGGLYGLGGLRFGLAEQAGLWQGLWSIGTASGPMTLNLIVDPAAPGLVTGNVQLVGNLVLPTLVSVSGEALNGQIILTGSNGLAGGALVTIDMTAILTSSTEMDGSYILTKGTGTLAETGQFKLTLTTPVL